MASNRLKAAVLASCAALAASRLGEPRQSPISLTLYSQYQSNVPYVLAEVGAAGLQTHLIIDSGSPLFWARSAEREGCGRPPYQPWASGLAEALDSQAEFGYGGGVVSGPLYRDSLRLASSEGKNETFTDLTVMAATTEVGMGCSSGILGMDMASVTAQRIFDSHGLRQLFTILLNPVPYFYGNAMVEAGTMILGGVDQSAYTGGLMCVPMLPMENRVNASRHDMNPQGVPLNNTAWWQLEISGVRVGSQQFGAAQGIVDTGTSLLAVPSQVLQYINQQSVDLSCENLNALPPIVLTLAGGHEVSLGPQQYITQGAEGSCDSAVMSIPDAPSGDFFVLGDPFFWKYAVTFDFVGKQVGLGLRAGVEGMPLPQTCGAALT